MPTRRLFLSVLWKAIIGCSMILTLMIMLFTWYNVSQLNSLQQDQREQRHSNYATQFTGLVERSAQMLGNIADTLPYLQTPGQSLADGLSDNWFTLQLTWGIEGAELFDFEGRSLGRWGDAWLKVSEDDLKATVAFGDRRRSVTCLQQCYLNLVSPVLDNNDTLYTIRLSASLADLMLDFRQISQADIGFMFNTRDLASQRRTPPAARSATQHWEIASLSNREALEPVLHTLMLQHPLPDSAPLRQLVAAQNTVGERTFDALFLRDQSLLGNAAAVVFIDDISAQRANVIASRNAYIMLGLLILLATIVLLVGGLWRPLMLVRNLSETLPLLPQGRFDEADSRLLQSPDRRVFDDELSELKNTAVTVGKQLADYRQRIESNNQRLHELAHFDTLTGLINRSHLLSVISKLFMEADGTPKQFGLLIIDLDNFKRINEGFGHHTGDEVLTVFAQRLQGCLSATDCAARLGGDEFCLVLDGIAEEAQLQSVVSRIQRALEEPFVIENRQIPIYCSIGGVLSQQHGQGGAELLQRADLALYRAKAEGKNSCAVFSPALLSDVDARLALEAELRNAVLESQFCLHYQAQIELGSQRLLGFEALIRWQHPTRGLLSPYFFIDALESNGLIVPLGKWIIDSACETLADWHRRGHALTLSINLSVRQFSDPHLLENIQQAVARHQIEPRYLEFEVTESLLATNIKHAITILNALRELGCTIAIDDFGTGYSSLAYLKQLPLDKLKVDRAFVKDIPNDRDDKQICTAIIAMAHSLGLKVVAEGIETREQEIFLTGLRCEIGQGYLFNKPMARNDAEQFYQLD